MQCIKCILTLQQKQVIWVFILTVAVQQQLEFSLFGVLLYCMQLYKIASLILNITFSCFLLIGIMEYFLIIRKAALNEVALEK